MLSLEGQEPAASATPASEFTMRDTVERLRHAIAALPRLQREVFLLRSQEGSDYAAIALALGTTSAAARVHYHHAVRRLKDVIA